MDLTHRGVAGLVPVWDGNMVVENFARCPFFGLSFPQDGVQIRKVVVNVDPNVAPTTQRPAAQLGTLHNNTVKDSCFGEIM